MHSSSNGNIKYKSSAQKPKKVSSRASNYEPHSATLGSARKVVSRQLKDTPSKSPIRRGQKPFGYKQQPHQ